MKAGFSIKLILYFALNCPQKIVAPNCPRRIVRTPTIEVVDKIIEALDHRKITISVFLDLSKAFATIKHDILFEKLHV